MALHGENNAENVSQGISGRTHHNAPAQLAQTQEQESTATFLCIMYAELVACGAGTILCVCSRRKQTINGPCSLAAVLQM